MRCDGGEIVPAEGNLIVRCLADAGQKMFRPFYETGVGDAEEEKRGRTGAADEKSHLKKE